MNNLDEKLRFEARIKEVAGIRFSASRRVHFNYIIAKLTVVILSLWAILITVLMSMNDCCQNDGNFSFNLSMASVLIPVFVVIFSLIEGGEQYLRAHNLNVVARKLRELADDVRSDKQFQDTNNNDWESKFACYYKKYNNILERHNVDHDDVDHLRQKFIEKRDRYSFVLKEKKIGAGAATDNGGDPSIHLWVYFLLLTWMVWLRRQAQRILYMSSWFLPFLLFLDVSG